MDRNFPATSKDEDVFFEQITVWNVGWLACHIRAPCLSSTPRVP